MAAESLQINEPPDWSEILQANRGWLGSIIYARLRDRHAVEEVLQETALAASRRESHATDQAGICRWLYTVAIRQAMLHRRQSSRYERKIAGAAHNGSATAAANDNPFQLVLASEQREQVRQAMEQLSSRDYQILMLKYAEGWSCHEMSVRLGVSETAMKSRLLRARKNLRKELLNLDQNWELR